MVSISFQGEFLPSFGLENSHILGESKEKVKISTKKGIGSINQKELSLPANLEFLSDENLQKQFLRCSLRKEEVMRIRLWWGHDLI